jgi:hypothetical protein
MKPFRKAIDPAEGFSWSSGFRVLWPLAMSLETRFGGYGLLLEIFSIYTFISALILGKPSVSRLLLSLQFYQSFLSIPIQGQIGGFFFKTPLQGTFLFNA